MALRSVEELADEIIYRGTVESVRVAIRSVIESDREMVRLAEEERRKVLVEAVREFLVVWWNRAYDPHAEDKAVRKLRDAVG